MGGFHFRLQKVLDYREILQNEKTVVYNAAQNRLKEQEQRLISYQNEVHDLLRARDENSKKTDIYELKQYHAYVENKIQQVNNQNVKVTNAKEKVKEAKEDLVEAAKEKMVLEKLKKQHHDIFLIDALKEEEKFIDQIVSFKNTMK